MGSDLCVRAVLLPEWLMSIFNQEMRLGEQHS